MEKSNKENHMQLNREDSELKESFYKPFSASYILMAGFVIMLGSFLANAIQIIEHLTNSNYASALIVLFVTISLSAAWGFVVYFQIRVNSSKAWSLNQVYLSDYIKLYKKERLVAMWRWDELERAGVHLHRAPSGKVKHYSVYLSFDEAAVENVIDHSIDYSSKYYISNTFTKRKNVVLFLAARIRQSNTYEEFMRESMCNDSELLAIYTEAVALAHSDKELNLAPLSWDSHFGTKMFPIYMTFSIIVATAVVLFEILI